MKTVYEKDITQKGAKWDRVENVSYDTILFYTATCTTIVRVKIANPQML